MTNRIRSAARPTAAVVPRHVLFFGSILKYLLVHGVPLGPNRLVTIRGRKSGLPRTTPLAVISVSGRRWVWAPWGEVQWVRNLRAAGRATITARHRREEVAATELDPDQRVEFFRGTLGPLARSMPGGVLFFRIADGVDLNHPVEVARGRRVFELHPLRKPRSQPRPQSQPQSRPSLFTVPPALSKVPKLARYVNPLVLKSAGTRLLPLYGVIEHRGRTSGKAYRTPVVVQPTGDGFVVPMPWGEGSDWYRNVRAAGECVVRWKGRRYQVVQPELIAPATARRYFNGFAKAFIKRFGIKHYLHLRLKAAEAPAGQGAGPVSGGPTANL